MIRVAIAVDDLENREGLVALLRHACKLTCLGVFENAAMRENEIPQFSIGVVLMDNGLREESDIESVARLVEGLRAARIAERLGIGHSTVRNHWHAIHAELRFQSKAGAVTHFLEEDRAENSRVMALLSCAIPQETDRMVYSWKGNGEELFCSDQRR